MRRLSVGLTFEPCADTTVATAEFGEMSGYADGGTSGDKESGGRQPPNRASSEAATAHDVVPPRPSHHLDAYGQPLGGRADLDHSGWIAGQAVRKRVGDAALFCAVRLRGSSAAGVTITS